jgi:CDP-glycerol glycerophosphotransferase (TagB/SpsB family)
VSCFNAADALITDVSSVLSDFLPSGKPLAVCAPQEQDLEQFGATFPSTRAADVLRPDGADLARFLGVVTGREPDTWAGRRQAIREYLFGPAEPPAELRFAAAVSALAARAGAQNPGTQSPIVDAPSSSSVDSPAL